MKHGNLWDLMFLHFQNISAPKTSIIYVLMKAENGYNLRFFQILKRLHFWNLSGS